MLYAVGLQQARNVWDVREALPSSPAINRVDCHTSDHIPRKRRPSHASASVRWEEICATCWGREL